MPVLVVMKVRVETLQPSPRVRTSQRSSGVGHTSGLLTGERRGKSRKGWEGTGTQALLYVCVSMSELGNLQR